MHRTTVTAAAVAALCLGLAACQPSGSADGNGGSPSKAAPEPSVAGETTPGPAPARTATLPDLVGKGLQSAQDAAQAAGFRALRSHDALGRGRMQAFDRNWKVCTQTPGPGAVDTRKTVDFGAVKLSETCPEKDAGAEASAAPASTMPDLRNKSVKVARRAFDTSTSISVKDASGRNRMVLVESHWKVCRQNPAAGTKLDGQPVTLEAVKFQEEC
ncbi:PASTA domain-containing protein [Streptomyces rimosus]|uniref:PASTA domain-containing protein n=1 Tax=Streptomyces rimosus TaxID=1927 RepID=UPI000518B921|nr:PASTA domain-containing protein [Streptomyces rimosus]